MLTIKQLKNIKINVGPTSKCGTNACAITTTLFDAISSYLDLVGTSIITDNTISGAGTINSPLKISSQGATAGQLLTWNGTS